MKYQPPAIVNTFGLRIVTTIHELTDRAPVEAMDHARLVERNLDIKTLKNLLTRHPEESCGNRN